MVPEIGNIALTLALVLSILLAVYPLWGAHRQHEVLMATAKPLAIGLFTFTLIAYVCLTYAFVTDDFSVAYVAQHSNSRLVRRHIVRFYVLNALHFFSKLRRHVFFIVLR